MATKNLGQISAIHISTIEPQNKNLIWRDIAQNPNLWKIWNNVSSVWEVVPSQAVANNFLNLGDTPVTYQGSGGKILKIKANLSGIEFADEVTFLSEISAAIAKGTLVDADEFLLADAGVVKKTAWSDIKVTLKTYFDTLYVSVSTVTSQLIANWNTAFGWGNHADAGYLTSETDPVFTTHPANNVVNNGDGTGYLSNDGTYKNLYHNDLLDREIADVHPQSSITGLVAKLIELEQSNPVRNVRFLRSTTTELFTNIYYDSTIEEGSGTPFQISQAITGTTQGTADFIAQFAGIPVPAGASFEIKQINVDVQALKNATSRVVSLFVEFWNMDDAGVLTQLGTSNILTLAEIAESKPFFVSLTTNYVATEGDRAVLIFRGFQTGTGGSAIAYLLVNGTTGSRWSFDTVVEASGGGHVILDPAGNTMPAKDALQFGDGFTVTDETGKTVVGNMAASHIDGADEEKHQINQIYDGLNPLSTLIPQFVTTTEIDMSDINVGEKKILVAEKDANGDPIFAGGVGLLDVIANPGLSTLLAETNPNWVGDEITLTGNNLEGQLGENSQFFELDADFFLCKTHDNGTTTSNGSATWKRNRGTDSLSLSIPAHVTIIDQLETEAGWNAVAQFKQITAKSKQGSWFRRSTGGYLYMCIDNSNGWTRIGTPPTTDLEITSTSHPILTASLAAHDFSINRFYVEGTEPTDEPAEQGQEWWDTTNKYVYRRNMYGNWARLNG